MAWMQSRRLLFRFSSYMYMARNTTSLQQVSLKRMSTPSSHIQFSTNTTLHNIAHKVEHNSDEKQFVIEVKDVGCAFLEYERVNNTMKIMHTEVPEVLGGKGLGKFLAKEALEYVAKNDLSLEIHCPFVRNYVSKYGPKYIKYLKE